MDGVAEVAVEGFFFFFDLVVRALLGDSAFPPAISAFLPVGDCRLEFLLDEQSNVGYGQTAREIVFAGGRRLSETASQVLVRVWLSPPESPSHALQIFLPEPT